jgi:hypothetical protein
LRRPVRSYPIMYPSRPLDNPCGFAYARRTQRDRGEGPSSGMVPFLVGSPPVVGEPELVGGSPGPVAAEPIALEPGVLAGEVRAAGQLRAGAGLADTATASSVHRGGVATRLAGVDESRVLVHTPAIATARWSGNLGCGGVWPGLGLGSSGNWRYPDPCGLSQTDSLSFLDGVLSVPCSVLGYQSLTEARLQHHGAQRGVWRPIR